MNKKHMSFKDFVEKAKDIKPAGGKAVNDVLRSKKGGAHFDKKKDFSRAKEKEKLHKELQENSNLLDKPTPSVEELVKLHGVSEEHLVQQVVMGIKVEYEHTSNLRVAKEIALDHLREDPNYYTKLKQMEKK